MISILSECFFESTQIGGGIILNLVETKNEYFQTSYW